MVEYFIAYLIFS